uniref:30S ribosomal protein S4 n=1 Tax=Nitzschia alba TaxID=2858 RepID=A0A5C0F2J6_NITAL|nr:30S ribosomal protein S4 [Nitzschia alba]QEI59574.1 30S ribosomal protein S4 [Nitzschia alba]
MSRYLGPKLKITRKLGLLPGFYRRKEKKNKKKIFFKFNNRFSDYRRRLEEKQKLKFNYGLTENQLFGYIKEAKRRKGITSLILIQLLEMRLDSLCFTLGFGQNIIQARQLINHGHITINKKQVNIPSFQCKPNDTISIREKEISKNLINNNIKFKKFNRVPEHINFNKSKLEAKILDYCTKENSMLKLKESLIIEYYSHK